MTDSIRRHEPDSLISGHTFDTLCYNGLPIVFDTPQEESDAKRLWFFNIDLFNPRFITPRGRAGRLRTWSYPRFAPLASGPAIWPDGSQVPTGVLVIGSLYQGFESRAYGRFKRREMQRRARKRRVAARFATKRLKALL